MFAIPSSMLEGREFVAGVYILVDNETIPIEGVRVYWLNGTFITDSAGRVILQAPYVDSDMVCEIFARKRGYLGVEGQILIINQLSQLILITPSEIHETKTLSLMSMMNLEILFEGARVGFRYGEIYFGGGFTGPNGTVVCTAPEVNQTTIYQMGALKPEYNPGFAQITILDTDSGFWMDLWHCS